MNKWSGKGQWIPWMRVSFGTTLPTMRELLEKRFRGSSRKAVDECLKQERIGAGTPIVRKLTVVSASVCIHTVYILWLDNNQECT